MKQTVAQDSAAQNGRLVIFVLFNSLMKRYLLWPYWKPTESPTVGLRNCQLQQQRKSCRGKTPSHTITKTRPIIECQSKFVYTTSITIDTKVKINGRTNITAVYNIYNSFT